MVADNPLPIYTIGHSTRPIDAFVALLRLGRVDMVVDVRSIPRSRTNPQFNLDRLPDELEPWQIGHVHIPGLGGRRPRSDRVAPETNAYWKVQSFHNYADHALGAEFRDGLTHLIELAERRHCAIMCAEAVWWRCHRRIITDYLLVAGRPVLHLMGENRVDTARLTPAAVAAEDGLHYPAPSG